MEGLAIQPDSRIMCIASGSCNALSYLTANPESVIAVDLNHAHVALGRLKIAAIKHLPVTSASTASSPMPITWRTRRSTRP